ncbi:DUF1433 domain-containing protein [Fictibacillus macauensis]|uniref:DUF1433 domain-containing protein n=1 Tax=Fictibacillus macauensis TaxID=245160 RepID=UPI003B75C26F
MSLRHYNEQNYWQTQEERVKTYILHNVRSAKTIMFTEKSYGHSLSAGYVNNNKTYTLLSTLLKIPSTVQQN